MNLWAFASLFGLRAHGAAATALQRQKRAVIDSMTKREKIAYSRDIGTDAFVGKSTNPHVPGYYVGPPLPEGL